MAATAIHPSRITGAMRLIATVALLTIAIAFTMPAAVAGPQLYVCTEGKEPCQGNELVCAVNGAKKIACLPDPCYTTRCF